MKAVRLGCAILATVIAYLGVLCIRPFNFHRELPHSAQTIQAIYADMANHTPESEALVMERTLADVEYNDRHEDIGYLVVFFSIIAVIWSLWWIADKGPFFDSPF